jgi:hypothetical protein
VTNSLAQVLSNPLPGQLPSELQLLAFGAYLRAMPTWIRRANPNTASANPYIIGGQGVSAPPPAGSAAGTVTPGAGFTGQLPDDAKAATIIRATGIAGTATGVSLIVDLQAVNDTNFASAGPGTGPAAGHIGVSPSGDIVTNATDAWTSVDVLYQPDKYDVQEYSGLAPVTAVLTLPTGATNLGVIALLEAEVLTGTVTGKSIVVTPSNTAPATTRQAGLNLAKTQVLFRVADAPATVRVKLAVVSAVDQNNLLELVSQFV